MARTGNDSISAIIEAALAPVLQRVREDIAKAVRDASPGNARGRGPRRPAARKGRRHRSRQEITKWAADRRARRVPTFVIEATGLDTKKAIVARYGENATFEKDKPLPTRASGAAVAHAQASPAKRSAHAARAKAPIIRKAAAASTAKRGKSTLSGGMSRPSAPKLAAAE